MKPLQRKLDITKGLGAFGEVQLVSWDWQKFFAIKRFRYIEVLFHIFHYYWGKENNSLYLGSASLYRVSLYVYHGFHCRKILN